MTDHDEQFVAGMAHCYHLLAQELRVKCEAFQTVWDFYYEHVGFVDDTESAVSNKLAFASSVMEYMENALESAYFDALDVEKGDAPLNRCDRGPYGY